MERKADGQVDNERERGGVMTILMILMMIGDFYFAGLSCLSTYCGSLLAEKLEEKLGRECVWGVGGGGGTNSQEREKKDAQRDRTVQFNVALRPQRRRLIRDRESQDGHLHFHTAPQF